MVTGGKLAWLREVMAKAIAPSGWAQSHRGPGRGRVKTDGRAVTFEDAKAQFAANWEASKAADRDSDS
jgi:hypothetical protein